MYKPSLEIHRNHHPPCSEPHPGQERQQDHHGFRFPDPQPHQRPYDPNPRPTRRRSVERPLDPTNMYCHQCQRLKPPRSHHCRRCGTCVLKMDHHCPWVGGCVGANNQRYFYIFVLWVTLLEIFTMVSTAVLFDRGVRWNRHAGRAGESVAGDGDGKASWKLDGYLISLFPITAIFTLFTGALLITHTYLLTHNLTTLEHMGINRVKAREEILIQNYLKRQESAARSRATIPNDGGRRWWKKQNWHIREIKEMRKGLDKDFGSLDKEANLWWIGGRREVQIADLVGFTDHKLRDLETGQNDEQGIPPFPNVILVDQSQTRQAKGREEGEDEKRAQDRTPTEIGVDPDRGSVKTRSKETKPTTSTADAAAAALVNFTQVMGDSPLLWFLPLPLPGDGTPSGKGLSFPVNPRFGPAGVLRSRDQWPPSL
ncbi:zf-DHHC-domain-containing protein [Violaceomyces palustris]|uniref:Zf-DHHC-domain-containing protein n=1 Tax=Violaceomyces palustris TaxID=1673888 RepID=A0ACD0NRM5_9BASI|nr:zf-DHHC-domain-containing protein [Violaceomyces palustris]